jgi:hypothetical protein
MVGIWFCCLALFVFIHSPSMLHYLFLMFASFETDHFSCGIPDCRVYLGIQEQEIKKQMFRSIILAYSCFLVSVNCVHTFLVYCLNIPPSV